MGFQWCAPTLECSVAARMPVDPGHNQTCRSIESVTKQSHPSKSTYGGHACSTHISTDFEWLPARSRSVHLVTTPDTRPVPIAIHYPKPALNRESPYKHTTRNLRPCFIAMVLTYTSDQAAIFMRVIDSVEEKVPPWMPASPSNETTTARCTLLSPVCALTCAL